MPEFRPQPFDVGNFDLIGGFNAGARLAEILGQPRGGPVGPSRRARKEAREERDVERKFQAGEAEKARQFEAGQEEKKALRTKEDHLNFFQDRVTQLVRGGMDQAAAQQQALKEMKADLERQELASEESRARTGDIVAGTELKKKEAEAFDTDKGIARAEGRKRVQLLEQEIARGMNEAEQGALRNKFYEEQLRAEIESKKATTQAQIQAIQQAINEEKRAEEALALAKAKAKDERVKARIDDARLRAHEELASIRADYDAREKAAANTVKAAQEAFEGANANVGGKFNQALTDEQAEEFGISKEAWAAARNAWGVLRKAETDQEKLLGEKTQAIADWRNNLDIELSDIEKGFSDVPQNPPKVPEAPDESKVQDLIA